MSPLFPFLKYLTDGTASGHEDYDSQQTLYISSLIYSTNDGAINAFKSASFNDGWIVGTNNGRRSEVHNFLTDHLGSVRQVVAADGSVIEQNDYYPFGKRWAAVAAPISDNRHRFSGKEEQAFLSLPYVDFGARMYNPDWGRWFTQDPLAEKYYPIGQYCYCAGNPVSFLDLDGRKLYFAPGVSESFKQKFAETIQYMNLCGTAGDIAKLQSSNNIYYIDEATSIEGTQFDPNTGTISWDPNHLVETTDGKLLSPATVLAHEADHAQKYDSTIQSNDNEVKQQYNESVKSHSDEQYSKGEERRVITGTEQEAARKHGDINKQQTTRTNSNGKQANVNIANMKPKEISRYIYETNNQYYD